MTDEIVEGFRALSAAVVADVFRYAGYPQQVMDGTILPFRSGWKVCGRAFTHSNLPLRRNERGVFDEAEASLQPGDVVVESYFGAWGLNYAVGASLKGCVGAVVDGSYRDIPGHMELLPEFPVFCRRGLSERSTNPGGSHRSFRTRWMHAFNVPINCGGVRVEARDVILGDEDGVVVIPNGIAEDVLRFARSLEEAEHSVIEAKRAGNRAGEAHGLIGKWARESGVLEWAARQD
jgi:4-hydroxy-4-methyl-2-oxoglutarate aldolase